MLVFYIILDIICTHLLVIDIFERIFKNHFEQEKNILKNEAEVNAYSEYRGQCLPTLSVYICTVLKEIKKNALNILLFIFHRHMKQMQT